MPVEMNLDATKVDLSDSSMTKSLLFTVQLTFSSYSPLYGYDYTCSLPSFKNNLKEKLLPFNNYNNHVF